MFVTILNIVVPVFLLVAAGAFYAHKFKPDWHWPNKMNIDVFVPALIFTVLSSKDFQIQNYLNLALATVLVVLGSGLLVWPLLRLFKVSARTFLPPMMFNNTGNMGIPLLVLAFGEAALPAAVTIFVLVNLMHFTLGIFILDSQTKFSSLFKNPIVLASVIGLVFSHFQIYLPSSLALPIEMLGQISIPLMLLALGGRLIEVDLSNLRLGIIGAVACPVSGVLVAYLVAFILQLEGQQWGILLVFAVMPPAVLNYMLAEKYQQEPQKVASIVLVGNFASLFFIPLALWVALI